MGVCLRRLPLHARAALHQHSYRMKSLSAGALPARSHGTQGHPAGAGAGPERWPGPAACPTLPPHRAATPDPTEEFMSHGSTASGAPRNQKLIPQYSFITRFKVRLKDVVRRGSAFLLLTPPSL